MENIMKYFMFVDIKNVNLDNLVLEKLQELFPNINITMTENEEVVYKDKGKILLEKFHKDSNNLGYSTIYFTTEEYNLDFIGYKFFSKDIVLILIKNSIELFSDFSFYEMNEKLDYMKIINNHIFNKIDLNKYNIDGYKHYIYFYINALIIKLKDELQNNGIIIKIIDENIDDFIDNHINQIKNINNNNTFIFIYCLLFQEHSAVLINIAEKLYLFDSSHYFKQKKNTIFKNLKNEIFIINLYKIQHLGVCSYYSIIFIHIITKYFIENGFIEKGKIFENDKFKTYVNSEEFICIFVKKLNEFFRNNEQLIITNKENNIIKKESDNKYVQLSNNIFINRNIYKIIFIDLNELFGFINPNYNKSDVFNFILDKNQLYLKVLETKYLYEELINILAKKMKITDEKYRKAAEKRILDCKIRKKMVNDKLFQERFKIFDKTLAFVDFDKKNQIIIFLKQELTEDFNEIEFNDLDIVIKGNIHLPNKDIFKLIKNKIVEIIEDHLLAKIFFTEYSYYTETYLKILSQKEEFMIEQTKIFDYLDKINNNCNDYKILDIVQEKKKYRRNE